MTGTSLRLMCGLSGAIRPMIDVADEKRDALEAVAETDLPAAWIAEELLETDERRR